MQNDEGDEMMTVVRFILASLYLVYLTNPSNETSFIHSSDCTTYLPVLFIKPLPLTAQKRDAVINLRSGYGETQQKRAISSD